MSEKFLYALTTCCLKPPAAEATGRGEGLRAGASTATPKQLDGAVGRQVPHPILPGFAPGAGVGLPQVVSLSTVTPITRGCIPIVPGNMLMAACRG